MKILHITQHCHAGSIGGTERYILDLIQELEALGVAGEILWLSPEGKDAPIECEGVRIHAVRGPASRLDDPPPASLQQVERLLAGLKADWLLHFHTLGTLELQIADVALRLGLKRLFTYHSPAWLCRRDDLLRWGDHLCDGEIRPWRCAACALQDKAHLFIGSAYAGAALSAALDPLFRLLPNAAGRWLRFFHQTRRYGVWARRFLSRTEASIICSPWGGDVLERNGAPRTRISLAPQGVSRQFLVEASQMATASKSPLSSVNRPCPRVRNIGYFGRISPLKGTHILVEAFHQTRQPDARLDIWGVISPDDHDYFKDRVAPFTETDPRIHLHSPLPYGEVANAYRALDLAVIPSTWPETGPLVLFEAAQMGIPVLGSERVGHLELLRQAGAVVAPNSTAAWREALTLAFDGEGVAGKTPPPPPTMIGVAQTMASLYRSVREESAAPDSDSENASPPDKALSPLSR